MAKPLRQIIERFEGVQKEIDQARKDAAKGKMRHTKHPERHPYYHWTRSLKGPLGIRWNGEGF